MSTVEYGIYSLGFFGMKILLPLSFLGRLRGRFGFCSLLDEDGSSTNGLFGSGCCKELPLGPAAGVGGFCDWGLARTDSARL